MRGSATPPSNTVPTAPRSAAPQHSTAWSRRSAHAWYFPAATADAALNRGTSGRRGIERARRRASVQARSGCCPPSTTPHRRRRARTRRSRPARARATPSRARGRGALDCAGDEPPSPGPSPRTPSPLLPQQCTPASAAAAHVVPKPLPYPPAATCVTSASPETAVGVGVCDGTTCPASYAPKPSSPEAFWPQQRKVWSSSNAQTCPPPDASAVAHGVTAQRRPVNGPASAEARASSPVPVPPPSPAAAASDPRTVASDAPPSPGAAALATARAAASRFAGGEPCERAGRCAAMPAPATVPKIVVRLPNGTASPSTAARTRLP